MCYSILVKLSKEGIIMNWIISDIHNVLIIGCGVFYSVLCIFSIVTGLMYASGKKALNPLELSDKFIQKLDTEDKIKRFAMNMGWVTFGVGLVQGLTAFSLFKGHHPIYYFIALGFTVFSILSVSFKLSHKRSAFALIKALCYVTILVILLLSSTRVLFF